MPKPGDLFQKSLKVVNIGIDSFFETMKHQNVPVIHVEWKPPAGGDDTLMNILDKLKQ